MPNAYELTNQKKDLMEKLTAARAEISRLLPLRADIRTLQLRGETHSANEAEVLAQREQIVQHEKTIAGLNEEIRSSGASVSKEIGDRDKRIGLLEAKLAASEAKRAPPNKLQADELAVAKATINLLERELVTRPAPPAPPETPAPPAAPEVAGR